MRRLNNFFVLVVYICYTNLLYGVFLSFLNKMFYTRARAHVYISFLVMQGTWMSHSLIKALSRKTVYTGDLLIVLTPYIEPPTLFGWLDEKRMVHQCTHIYQPLRSGKI